MEVSLLLTEESICTARSPCHMLLFHILFKAYRTFTESAMSG